MPAQEIEQTIIQIAKNILNDSIAITTAISESSIPAHHIPVIVSSASELSRRSDVATNLINRVDLRPDGITITISLKTLIENTVKASSAPLIITKNIPIQMKRRGVEMRLVIDNNNSSAPDRTLIKTIARTRKWFDDLASGKVKSISAIAEGLGVGLSYVSNSLPLAFLAPEVVEAIISGRQPVDLTADTLIKKIKLPLQWSEQERIFNL